MFGGFLLPSANAHGNQFTIRVRNMTDRKSKKGPSLFRVLRMLESNKDGVAPEVRDRLDKLEPILKKVELYRHRFAAHKEIGAKLPGLDTAKFRPLLDKLDAIFKLACEKATSTTYDTRLPHIDDPAHALQALSDAASGRTYDRSSRPIHDYDDWLIGCH